MKELSRGTKRERESERAREGGGGKGRVMCFFYAAVKRAACALSINIRVIRQYQGARRSGETTPRRNKERNRRKEKRVHRQSNYRGGVASGEEEEEGRDGEA